MRLKALLALLLSALAVGCSPQALAIIGGVGEGLQSLGSPATARAVSRSGDDTPQLFGGAGHKTYLGCMCEKTAANSVLNTYSEFGSKYSSTSIFNPYSDYGSKYANYSACNPYATDPPVVVTGSGAFVGRLTLNEYVPGALRQAPIMAWLKAVCAG